MCTVRCSGRRWGGGVSARGGGLSALGCVCSGRGKGLHRRGGGACLFLACVCSRVGCLADPCGQYSWHTFVKTLPFRNYCCGRSLVRQDDETKTVLYFLDDELLEKEMFYLFDHLDVMDFRPDSEVSWGITIVRNWWVADEHEIQVNGGLKF